MSQLQALSPRFNLSLGFLPGVIAILAGFFISPETALYTGAGAGLVLSLACWRLLPLLLYGSTIALAILALLPFSASESYQPLLIECFVFFPTLLVLLFGRRWIQAISPRRHRFIQGVEAAIVSARILFLLVLLHGVLSVLTLLLTSAAPAAKTFLCRDVPLGVLSLPILFNQIGLYYFNRKVKQLPATPLVNLQGEVIGKKPRLAPILRSDTKNIYPVVRIAITAYRMLYLMPRPQTAIHEEGKEDLPLESYLFFGEHVGQAARRIIHNQFPQLPTDNLHCHCSHHYQDDKTNRLVYLCTLELENDDLLPHEGKLWTFSQLQQNLGKHYFSKYLEYEYDSLKNIIYTREKYKESWKGPANAPAIP